MNGKAEIRWPVCRENLLSFRQAQNARNLDKLGFITVTYLLKGASA